jgi:C4-dicarboxylate-specific signal transduction histidine kinase
MYKEAKNSEFSIFDNEEKVIKQAEELADSFSSHAELVHENMKSLIAGYRKSYKEQQRLVRVSDRQQEQLRQLTVELREAKDELKSFNEKLSERVEEELSHREELEKENELQQAVLLQQTKMAELGNMIGAIAHQWKQPLNAIALFEQALIYDFKDGSLGEEAIKEHTKSVLSQINFMAQTIDDFRNFYKPSTQKQSFCILKEVKSMLSLMEGEIKASNIKITISGDEEVCAFGYSGEFKHVVLNIVNNAKDAFVEHKLPERSIDICAKQQDGFVLLSITDNAGGIPASVLPGIFDPFVSTKGLKGTGIGLSLAKVIIEEKMDGKISAKNIENGAEFLIELPVD